MVRTAATDVLRARLPAVDAHNHLGRWLSGDGTWMIPDVGACLALMDELNLESVVNLDGRWGAELEANLDRYDRAHPGRFVTYCHVDWRLLSERDGPERLGASLRASVGAGAAGLKIWKDLGLEVRDRSGALVLLDDPRLSPLLATAGELGVPVVVHVGDPCAFFEPVDRYNERLEELMISPGLSLYGKPVPPMARLLEAFESAVGAHPATTFIAAHMAIAEDLAWVGRALAEHPNLAVDVGARLAEMGRQPRATRALIERFSDRVLFGADVYPMRRGEYSPLFRFFETDDEHFAYSSEPVPPQGRWSVSGIALPEELLAAVYRDNARRLIPVLGARSVVDLRAKRAARPGGTQSP